MHELATIARHAGTVLAGQLAIMAFGVTDTIVAGRYSADALAALSVASALFVSVYVSLMGVLQALLPIWAEQHGRGETAAIGASFRQSLYLALGFTLLGMVILVFPDPILNWTEVPESMQGDVRTYLIIVGWALPSAMFFRLYTTLNQALGRPQLVTWLQVGALVLKVPLSIWFTFGGWGLEPQGAAGCAWATLLVDYAIAIVAIVLMRYQKLYAPLQLWQRMEAPDFRRLAAFLRLGVPAGLSILVEVTSFTLVALFVARQGALSAASHQIAANLAAVCYMVPLSLGIAISARVSWWRGTGNEAQAQKLAWMGLKIAAASGLVLSGTLLLAREALPQIYTADPGVVALTSALLLWVALYHASDSIQCVCIFLLRCWRVTVAPLIVYCSLLWGGGLAGGYWLAYKNEATSALWSTNPTPFWIGSGVSLALVAIIFIYLMRRVLLAHRH
ncbi:MATE family efflux transporter [Comamonas kerstersii]|uniref:MATE family efflux transporter n=1 Tax=Comamonas kerstersii TaxID=225992 RepID=A0A0W7Z394_9BURK|nr:MATE family efflux transporter [Comamonas kerstersii]AQZ97027.1 MATE family efflux transporter [Comamonas kerstersii]KAB0587546.1 MATE family efflux transporter [Comamonas kerstersii]KUF41834.1 MATE family efflux transporter [Comamonas kerstersii]OOH88560.1 MATE family efflux transporter [Comamonas kerstersii]OOH95632.1 MATE family efflux transporter [Comamonas kerstersii]